MTSIDGSTNVCASPTTKRQTLPRCKVGLLSLALLLPVSSIIVLAAQAEPATADWRGEPSFPQTLLSWGIRSARVEGLRFALVAAVSLIVGLVVAWIMLPTAPTQRRLAATVTLVVLISFAAGIFLVSAPLLLASIPVLVGSLFGIWCAAAVRSRRHVTVKLLTGGAALLLVVLAGATGLVLMATDRSPSSFAVAVPTPSEKSELIERLKGTQLLSGDPTDPREVRLNEMETNILLGWKLALDNERKTHVFLSEDGFLLLAAVPLEIPGLGRRFVNAQLSGRLEVQAGQIQLSIDGFRLGRLQAPSQTRARLAEVLVEGLQKSREVQPLLALLESLRIRSGKVELTTSPDVKFDVAVESLFDHPRLSAELKRATVEQVEHLVELVSTLPERPQFEQLLQASFQKAYEQSQTQDPRAANRAALVALGIVLAGPQLARLVDHRMNPELDSVLRRLSGRVQLRGRADWTQHFCGSAALTAVSGESVSDLAGLIKEEIDAATPGSGFSFSDLLADRAGSRFAQACLRSPAAARALQDRVRRGISVSELLPHADGLPENIDQAELTSAYGGIGGPKYQQLLDEIERRLDQTPLLRRK